MNMQDLISNSHCIAEIWKKSLQVEKSDCITNCADCDDFEMPEDGKAA